MRTIWKYELGLASTIEIPGEPDFLDVQMQVTENGRHLCAWFEVDPTAKPRPYKFHVIGTGHKFEKDNLVYLASVQNGEFVWHVYWESDRRKVSAIDEFERMNPR